MKKRNELNYSGSSWLGNIPKSWKIKLLKHYSCIFSGGTPDTNKEEYWNGDVPWLNSGEVNKREIRYADNFITQEGLKNSSAKIIPINSLVLALAGQGKTKGMVAIVLEKGICGNQSLGVITLKTDYNPKFMYFYLFSKYEDIRGLVGGTRDGLNLNHLKNIVIPFCDKKEQDLIVDFLDKKTSLIDKKISLLEKKIELYEEYKNSIIKQTVDSCFVDKVKMKKVRLKDYTKYINGYAFKDTDLDFNEDTGRVLVKITEVTEKGVVLKDTSSFVKKNFDNKNVILKNGDILVCLTGDDKNIKIGKFNSLDDKEYLLNQRVAILRGSNKLNQNLLYYLLKNVEFQRKIILLASGGTAQTNIAKDHVIKTGLFFPELSNDQIKVANFLDSKFSKIDKLIELTKKEIELQKEYKKTLINDVVTGKIEV